jgi:hypothetical protein
LEIRIGGGKNWFAVAKILQIKLICAISSQMLQAADRAWEAIAFPTSNSTG